jgi:hypothetical protein
VKRLLLVLLATIACGVSAAYAGPPDPQHGHAYAHGHGKCHHGHGHGHAYGHQHHGDCDDGDGNGGNGNGGNGNGGNAGGGNGGTGGTVTPGGTSGTVTPGGTGAGGSGVLGVSVLDTTAPAFLAIPRLHPRRFRAARRRGPSIAVRTGTTITYTLSEPARVTFTVQKYRHLSRVCRRRLAARSRHRTGTRCRRWISLKGRFATASAAGASSVRFTGRLNRRPLRPGYYRLVIRARDAAGNITRPRRPTFRIVR